MTPKKAILIMVMVIGALFVPMLVKSFRDSSENLLFIAVLLSWIWAPLVILVIGVLLGRWSKAPSGADSTDKGATTTHWKRWALLIILGVSLTMCVMDRDHWKEEVLLQDGTIIVVERSQSYGGARAIGQRSHVAEQKLSFTAPSTKQTVRWESEPLEGFGYSSLNLLALHIQNGTPYIVTKPNGCLSYNKWGRPNPPYVIFKYDGATWQPIPLSELPLEFKDINVLIHTRDELTAIRDGDISAAKVKQLNAIQTKYPNCMGVEERSIIREPLKPVPGTPLEPWTQSGLPGNRDCSEGSSAVMCEEMVPMEDGWTSIDWFSSAKTYEACLEKCERNKVSAHNCPCNKLFKGK